MQLQIYTEGWSSQKGFVKVGVISVMVTFLITASWTHGSLSMGNQAWAQSPINTGETTSTSLIRRPKINTSQPNASASSSITEPSGESQTLFPLEEQALEKVSEVGSADQTHPSTDLESLTSEIDSNSQSSDDNKTKDAKKQSFSISNVQTTPTAIGSSQPAQPSQPSVQSVSGQITQAPATQASLQSGAGLTRPSRKITQRPEITKLLGRIQSSTPSTPVPTPSPIPTSPIPAPAPAPAPTPTPSPVMSLTPTSLVMATQQGTIPGSQTVSVSNVGGGSLSNVTTSVTSGNTWLKTSLSGTTVTASVTNTSLSPGTYNGMIAIFASGATNSPQTVPVTLTVTAPPKTSATLTWNLNTEPDLAGYKVYQKTSAGAQFGSPIATLQGKIATYKVTGLQLGNTYSFAIKAYDNSGNESNFSNEVSTSIF